MAAPGGLYGRGGPRPGGLYAGRGAGRAKQDDGSFLGNLGGDIKEAVLGFPAGIKNLATDPVDTVKAIGQSYAETYGPLFRGDIGEFGRRIYEHPLGPILDLATVATFGVGSVAKGGQVLAKAGRIAPESRLARLGQPGRITFESPAAKAGLEGALTVTKPTSRRPLRKAQQLAWDRFLKQFAADRPLVGEFARLARELDRPARRKALARQIDLKPYQKAYLKLSEAEQIALGLIGRAVTPDEYKALLLREQAAGATVEPRMLALLDREDVRAAVASPSARLLDAVEKGRAVGEKAAEILREKGRLGAEAAEARRFLPARLASGAEFRPKGLGRAFEGDPIPVGQEAFFADDQLRVISPEDASRAEMELVGGKTIEDLREQFAREGRIEPFYLPDIMAEKRTSIGRSGGGFGVPRSPIHRTHAVIFLAGQIALQPDVLSVAYLRTVRYALYDDIHTALLESAIRVPKNEARPKGFEYIRRPAGRSRSPEKIPYTQRELRDFRDEIEDLLPENDRVEFSTRTAADAIEDGDYYLAIPQSLAKQATGEFLRSGQAVRWLLEKPTSVWRALVLNLRPAWLVNNIVGNHFLYALRFAGLDGLVAYVRAVRDAGRADAPFRRLVETYIPEQAQGTFLQTQTKGTFLERPGRRTGRTVTALTGGLRPLDIGVEQTLRRAAVEVALRRSPEIKARLRRMWGETEVFEEVAEQALRESPELARRISDEVNAALGDFLNMAVFERQVLRAVFPFYAWYKAITLIVGKMPLETPGRADLLSKLGQTGADETEAALGDIPTYLKGVIPLGRNGDRARVFNTTPVNPLATIPGLAANVSGAINPFIGEAARAVVGESRYDSVSFTEALKGAGQGGYELGAGLPQIRLAQALTGTLYQGTPGRPTLYKRTPRDELLAYLGIPYRDMSLSRARQLAGEER